MEVLFIVGLLLLGISGAMVLRAFVLPRLRVVVQVRQIGSYGFQDRASAEPGKLEGRAEPRLATAASAIGSWTARRISTLEPLDSRRLMAAGIYNVSVEQVHGYRVLGAAGLPFLMLALGIVSGSLTALTAVLILVLVVLVWLLSGTMIRSRGQRRLDSIDSALPELIDVLTATIEAGLGFAGSLQLCTERFDGPLGQELRLMLQEQTMGLSTEGALSNMRERCDTPSVRAFARAVSQGESLGVSIGTMMRNLAVDTRKRRRALARERVQKAPVKLLFPLVFLIFPALFIVLLFPALYNVITTLGG